MYKYPISCFTHQILSVAKLQLFFETTKLIGLNICKNLELTEELTERTMRSELFVSPSRPFYQDTEMINYPK